MLLGRLFVTRNLAHVSTRCDKKQGADHRRRPIKSLYELARRYPHAPPRLLARVAQLVNQRLQALTILGGLGDNQDGVVTGERTEHVGQLGGIDCSGNA